MNFVFLMDPLENVMMEKDTSFLLMLGAYRRGHDVYFLGDGGINRMDGKTQFYVNQVIPQLNKEQPFIEKDPGILGEEDIDIIFIRSDPPFDNQYLLNTWLLDLLPARIPIINSPAGIRCVNEKLWATQFTSIIPRTLVSRNKQDLREFLSEQKEIVAKPTDGYGGQSIFHIQGGDDNANVILETLTQNWTKEIILQQYLPESQQGDKRILLLNGEALGAVLRVHAQDDHRNNFFSGGKPQPTEITQRDQEIIEILKPKLQTLGLYFVGIDIIDGYLIEINVTSPTCLQEINRLYNLQLEDKIIDFAENLIHQKQSSNTIIS